MHVLSRGYEGVVRGFVLLAESVVFSDFRKWLIPRRDYKGYICKLRIFTLIQIFMDEVMFLYIL